MIKKTKIRSRKLGNWTDEAEKSNGRTAGKSNDDSEIRGRKLAIHGIRAVVISWQANATTLNSNKKPKNASLNTTRYLKRFWVSCRP
uniref:Uncharacterized protein n=1 Tax=Helianthus annuus TaxID=4232 RepID=A0A251UPD9_HELAN